ncbi:unnamed protein product [Caenorhabditis angaria]|uniref:VWFA domain-containing protein n=1 Tax=Caenorhabditis angaria TaxID=860376 RepID=A0A9P1IA84_9PELO|nr:unnamed protein product [Caenorhabditis angaria]
MSILIFLLIISSSVSAQERLCGNDLSNLWLDVVYVIDNSIPMTNSGLIRASAQIISVFGGNTKIGSGFSDPRSTRVGIVTYNTNASVAADLNRFGSFNDLVSNIYGVVGSVSSSNQAILDVGLTKAKEVLDSGRANNVRSNYQPVIVIYASQFVSTSSVLKTSENLKNSGITIITIPFAKNVDLSPISSPHSNIDAGGYQTVTDIQNRLLQINCFCPNNYIHVKTSTKNYGSCIKVNSLAAAWIPARLACSASIAGGYLANELNQDKHDFIFETVQNSTNFHEPYSYFIGLSNSGNGTWFWERANGNKVALSTQSFWNPNYPPQSITTPSYVFNNQTSSSTIGWQTTGASAFGYICEVITCDTDNYCS